MKNAKHVRQLMALCLALVLVVTLASSAMAASVSWDNDTGYTYTATVSKTADNELLKVPVLSARTSHTQGTPTNIPGGTRKVTATGDMTFPSTYSSWLTSAATKEGLSNHFPEVLVLAPE